MMTMEGPLCKWTNVMKGWQYRYFVLDYSQALLSYYTSKEKMVKGDRRGCVRLKAAVLGINDEDDSTFTITVDGKMFHFQAHDSEERGKWVSALEDTILRHTHRRRNKRTSPASVPTLVDFEKKLTETDAYLQLLISQVRDLDQKLDSAVEESDKESLVLIKGKVLTLLDGVKHTIVLLQIAKNTVIPVNGVLTDSGSKSLDTIATSESVNSGRTRQLSSPSSTTGPSSVLDSSGELGDSLSEKDAKLSPISGTTPPDNRVSSPYRNRYKDDSRTNGVPEMSYSSSDDDDFFYDAPEDTPSSPIPIIDMAVNKIATMDGRSLDGGPSPVDYDAMYDDETDEDELANVEIHGSVISHLISQVKIGMDLTKVALPTFILERRSLLEMYADFFAHPDLFISIPDFETPEERFIQTVRWFMSAFHAGRNSNVAKKPYNPVLGETFKCFWNIPNVEDQGTKVEDGPIPWAGTNNLTFIAEQVSHHPPISAFYAEHAEKRIMCSAYIYTKSKFLGLSIGVHNLGQGSIYLLDRGEEYTVTFPSAYGRSILTVPWVELGGPIHLNCPQTGYSANIEFLTKPFYGGKKHKVSGDIFNPNKKSIFTITGEWNGVMNLKASNGLNRVFVDTKTMKTVKKQVKPISEQESYESRRLWKDVTLALKLQDVNMASNSKYAVEQNQRELVKERQNSGEKWDNRTFHPLGDHWYYNKPLTQRQSKHL